MNLSDFENELKSLDLPTIDLPINKKILQSFLLSRIEPFKLEVGGHNNKPFVLSLDFYSPYLVFNANNANSQLNNPLNLNSTSYVFSN